MEVLKTEISLWLSSRRRMINLLIGLGAVALYEFLRAYYRPYVYSQGFNDFHIADTLGNSIGTVAQVFVFVSVLGRDIRQDYFLIRIVTISIVIYELAHPLLGKPIDPWDILATVLAGVFCEIVHRLIHGRGAKIFNKEPGISSQ
jgi:hypothetical protein